MTTCDNLSDVTFGGEKITTQKTNKQQTNVLFSAYSLSIIQQLPTKECEI